MNNEAATQTLQEVVKLIPEIPFVLMAGTLLGFHREKDFISFDKDIDLGIIDRAYRPELFQRLIDNGWGFETLYLTLLGGYEYTFKKGNIKIDFYVLHKVEHGYWHAAYYWGKKENINGIWQDVPTMIRYNYSVKSFHPVEFKGHDFLVPENIEKHLAENYGDWKTPNPKYNYVTDSPVGVDTKIPGVIITRWQNPMLGS